MLWLAAALAWAAGPQAVQADSDDAQDDDAGWGDPGDDAGWGDPGDQAGFAPPEAAPPPTPPAALQLGGSLRHDEALWVERLDARPWAKARTALDLELSWHHGPLRAFASGHGELDAAVLVQAHQLDAPSVDAYGWQLLPRQLWLAGGAGPIEIIAGHQLVSWGEGTLISPLDVVNPRDLREPGLTDLDDLRLPVSMLRVSWFAGDHRLELSVVPEADFGFRSPPMGLFGPVPALLAENDTVGASFLDGKTLRYDHVQRRWDLVNTGVFGRWRYQGPGVDLGLYAASLLDQLGTLSLPDPLSFLLEDEIALPLNHGRYSLLGHSGAAPLGPVLLRWELAADLGLPLNTGDLEALIPVLEQTPATLVTGMMGVETTLIPHTTLGLELSQGAFPQGPPQGLIYPLDATSYGLRISLLLLRERLRVDGVALGFGGDLRYGGLARLNLRYVLRDAWSLSLGAISYQPGAELGPIAGLDRHDRVNSQLRWDF